jgi:Trypsin
MRLRSSKTLTAPTERNACVRWAAVVFAMVASLFLAIACAPSKKTAERGSTTFVTTVPNDKAPTVYATPKLVCATPGGLCPEALALFVSRSIGEKDSEFFQCTSFLVAPNMIATNSHCIPQDLRAENASCSGRIQAIFGRSAHAPAQKFDCERVLSSSQIFEEKTHPEYMKRPDYAFIQLKSAVPRRQPLRFSREGLPDGFLLKVPTIDPSEDPMEIRSTLKIKTCRTMQNSLVSPGYTHAFANLASSAGCETIHGNSGSPMLDVSGRVRAILYGARDGKDQLGHTGAVEMPKKFKTTTLLSNAACIETPQVLNLGRADSRCSQTSDDRIFERAISETPLNVSSLGLYSAGDV